MYHSRPRNLGHHVNRNDKTYFLSTGALYKNDNAPSFATDLVGDTKDRDF